MNIAELEGILLSHPQTGTGKNGWAWTRLLLETKETWSGKDGQTQERRIVHAVVAFGRTAGELAGYVQGDMLHVEGRLSTRRREGADGHPVYEASVIVEDILSRKALPHGAAATTAGNPFARAG